MKLTFLEIPFASPLFDESIRLRYDVLREPLDLEFSVNDILAEQTQIHLGGYDEQMKLRACLVLFPQEEGVVKMRQVAVDPDCQKMGLGTQLVIESEKWSKRNGYKHMMMHARESAIPFYARLGYEKYGRKFTEVKVPHYRLRKDLK